MTDYEDDLTDEEAYTKALQRFDEATRKLLVSNKELSRARQELTRIDQEHAALLNEAHRAEAKLLAISQKFRDP